MKTLLIRKRFPLLCLTLSMVLMPASLAQDNTPSVLSRVQTVDDRELGELLRVALDRGGRRDEEVKIVRAVTESYAQIKLLDRQIEQIQQRLRSVTSSADLRHELLLAEAELESKRIVELANLREAMGIIPEHPFGRRSVSQLETWLELDSLDGTVHAIEHIQPFTEDHYRSVGLMSQVETQQYVRKLLEKPEALPIRIDIHWATAAREVSEELQRAVIRLVDQAGRQMQAEVHRDGTAQPSPWRFYLRLEPGSPRVEVVHSGQGSAQQDHAAVEPNGLESYLTEQFARPARLPAQLDVVYPASMQEQADRMTKAVQDLVDRLGIGKFARVARRAWEPDPQARYLGRWQAIGKSEIVEVSIDRQREAQISQFSVPDSGVRVHPAKWSGDRDGITIQRGQERYNGYINAEGNLVLGIANEPVVFKKVE